MVNSQFNLRFSSATVQALITIKRFQFLPFQNSVRATTVRFLCASSMHIQSRFLKIASDPIGFAFLNLLTMSFSALGTMRSALFGICFMPCANAFLRSVGIGCTPSIHRVFGSLRIRFAPCGSSLSRFLCTSSFSTVGRAVNIN